MPVTAADLAIPEEEASSTPLPVDEVAAADEEDTTAQDVAAADDLTADEAPAGGDTAIPEGGAPSGGAKITRVADIQEPAPPPFIPYHPAMSTDQKKLIDHLNVRNWQMFKGEQAKYNHALTSADQDRRLEYRLNRSEQRAKELQRGQQGYTTLEHQRQEAVRARQAEQQRNASVEENKRKEQAAFEKTPEGRAEKEYQSARRAGLNTQGTIKDDDEAVDAAARFLDLGAQKRFTENKGEFSKYGTNYTTNENAPNKEGLSDAYSKALDGVLNERQEVGNNPRGDGSKGVDPYSAPQIKAMSNAEKRGMVGLITSIGVRNPSVSPDLITRAVLNVAYNTGVNNFGVDHKKGMFYVGGSGRIPGLSFSMSGDEFKQLIQLRKNTEAEEAQLRAAILDAQKSNSKPQ